MKVIIIGPGALGCLLAAKLSRGNEVWLLDHDPERAGRLAVSGLLLEEEGVSLHCPVRATAAAELIGPADLALLCVKSHQVQEAVAAAWPALQYSGLFVALPNGISHLETLMDLCRGLCWGIGVTSQGATLAGPGLVLHRGAGATTLGLPPGQSFQDEAHPASCRVRLTAAADTLTQAGVPTQAVADILPHLWGKFLINLGINALTALHNCPNGALLENADLAETMSEAVREGARVAEKLGITLADDPVVTAREVCRATATNVSSMRQDIRMGRQTEIEALNGALVRLAQRLGIPVPLNEELARQVRALVRNNHVFIDLGAIS